MATRTTQGDVRDVSLAGDGEDLVRRAAREMPVLRVVRARFERERPLRGLRIGACLPVTSRTANLMLTLLEGGADVALCASDPLRTNDAVAAALVRHGVATYAARGEDEDTCRMHVAAVLAHRPNLTIDDGAHLAMALHRGGGRALGLVVGGTEASLEGTGRLSETALRYPIVTVDGLAAQALCVAHLARHRGRLEPAVHALPPEIRAEIARLESWEDGA
jgi:adenosylhomocysteinase